MVDFPARKWYHVGIFNERKEKEMNVYVATILTERDMDIPENDVIGVYKGKEDAIDAIADEIVSKAKRDEDFRESLERDENHEDFPGIEDEEKAKRYVKDEFCGGYYVFDGSNSYHFDAIKSRF